MHTNEQPAFLYKIISELDWTQSQTQTTVKLPPLDKDFIHLAEEHQVQRIIDKFWSHADRIVILKLDSIKLKGHLVKEKNPGGTTAFYHLYEGSIPMNAVVEATINPK